MSSEQINSYIQEAKQLIPRGGQLGKDLHLILDDVLHQRSSDVLADIERVGNACKLLSWEWAKSAFELLEKAADEIRGEKR